MPDGEAPGDAARSQVTDDDVALWRELLEDARWYPSPHNSQPIKVRPTGPRTAEVLYDLDLGLPAESFGIPFGHVCAGVFLEALAVVAAARGLHVVEHLTDADMDFASADRNHLLGTVELVERPRDGASPIDPVRAAERLAAFRRRRTSRRPYDATLVEPAVVDGAAAIAAAGGHVLRTTADAATVTRLVRINQATLFADLRNDDVYGEIMAWLRFSRREAAERADGLSAETMLMPGRVLRFAMGHRGLWEAPVVGSAIRWVYLRTMRGVRQLAWMEGPFAVPADHVEAGRLFMRVWLHLTEHDVALHPFGTVITNPGSHAALLEEVGGDESGGRMVWMLFRLGRSRTPPAAHRRPAAAMLLDPRGSTPRPAVVSEHP